jgi:flagellar basal-body rod modification protein FlgD
MALIQQVKDGKFVDETTGKSSTSTKSSEKDKKTNELGYDQFLQILCAEMQYQDPLEPTSNTEYIAQLATFSQLESQLSVQSTIEASSANDLVGKYVIMKVTSSTTGETSYIAGTCDYVLHKNGETFLSVNDGLYNLKDLDTVADATYMEAVTLAETIKSAISLLPSKNSISLANKDDIESIRKMYDGLNDYQKKFVSKDSWKKFEELEARLKELIKANESADGKTDSTDKADSTGKTDSTDKADSTGKTDSTDKSDSTDKTEETESAGSGDTTDNSSDRTE